VRDTVYRNRRRIHGARGKRLLRQRGERLERPCAHLYETGRMQRVHLRGHDNILKRLLIHVGALNLGLLMRARLASARRAVFKDTPSPFFAACGRLSGSRRHPGMPWGPDGDRRRRSVTYSSVMVTCEDVVGEDGFCHGLLDALTLAAPDTARSTRLRHKR
jgi:hypothetical protein